MAVSYDQDIASVARIDVVPTLLDTVCKLTGMGFAAVARVTEERWIACSVRDDIDFGLKPGGELKLETTICHEIRQSGEAVIISDVQADKVFCDHHTPAMYGFRSYISMPIILPDGAFFGTLCAIDPEPRDLDRAEIRDVFKMFADLVGFHLTVTDRMSATEATLADERELGEVREQFIAVLGHDLRNPLASVGAGVTLLRRAPDVTRTDFILAQMQGSVDRMTLLIDNILDLARSRLGGGISLHATQVDFDLLLDQVVAELASAHPDHEIRRCGTVGQPILCDGRRMGQLLSNLIGNAIAHGAADCSIEIGSDVADGTLRFWVANGGEAIPEAARALLFHPFHRGQTGAHREGLGLGLYIASQIASAHGGELMVDSTAAETRFTFCMPLTGSV